MAKWRRGASDPLSSGRRPGSPVPPAKVWRVTLGPSDARLWRRGHHGASRLLDVRAAAEQQGKDDRINQDGAALDAAVARIARLAEGDRLAPGAGLASASCSAAAQACA